MGRRGENIHKRSDGRWEARVVIGAPVCGRTQYKYLFAHSYQEARARKKAFLINLCTSPAAAVDEAAAGHSDFSILSQVAPLPVPARPFPCFSAVAGQWLASQKLAIKESSYALFSIIIDKLLLPKLGYLDIRNVDSEQIALFLSGEKSHGRVRDKGPLSDKTLSEIKSILNRILRYAKSQHLINEVPESLPITVKKIPEPVFSDQELNSIEKQAQKENTPFGMGVLLASYTGIREGEICALQWKDFDWENGTISVSKTVSRIKDTNGTSGAKTHVVIGTPKTVSSNRTIPVPESVLAYFKKYAGPSENYVMTGNKKHMEPRVCRTRFARFLKRAGVKHHTFHTLRHTYATVCVEQGMDIKALSEILGHSDVSITLARYVHPSMESKKAQVNKLKTFATR